LTSHFSKRADTKRAAASYGATALLYLLIYKIDNIQEMDVLTPARACLKIAFREMRIQVCGRFASNEGDVAGYVDRKWGVQIAGMNFQTRSNTSVRK
jgi:hypothetical protein